MEVGNENGNSGCKQFLLSGVVSVLLTGLAFYSGANAMGMILIFIAIASFGFSAGSVMNTPEPMHKD